MKTEHIKIIKIVALVLVIVSLITHFSTYFYYSKVDYTLLMVILVLGAFGVFIPAILLQKEILSQNHIGVFWKEFLSKLPFFYKASLPVLMLYVLFNFFYALSLNESCSPQEKNGIYTLEYKGEVRKIITQQQFYQHRAYEFRALSGHFMLFQYFSFVILIGVIRKREKYL